MLTIDGAEGEGGGQIVRSALALATLTGQSVRLIRVRAGRSRPGLMNQHLTAVTAAAEVCGADVQGHVLGSTDLTFRPGPVRPADYAFRTGTAGSTTLVLQTVLPALMTANGRSTVTLQGGTHNPLAPPFDFLLHVYLPLVNRMGPHIEAQMVRPGFYPVGGGEFRVTIQPTRELHGVELIERGEVVSQRVQALVSRLPSHIGRRECQTIAAASGWPDTCFEVTQVLDTRGPGNVVMIEINSQHVSELFTGFGSQGVRAEVVAQQTWDEASAYLESGVPVGPHLADQLMLPLAWTAHRGQASSFRTLALTGHSRTHVELLRKFLGCQIQIDERAENDVWVQFS